MWTFFSMSIILVVAAVGYMLVVYPAKGITYQVKIVTGYAWLTTLMICCIVPLDVVATLHGEDSKAIGVLWDIPYWSTQALTWFLIPVYMEYANAGEFTWGGRMWRALKSNLTFYLLMGVIGAVGLAWGQMQGKLDLAVLPSLGMQLSNTFGLLCVLVLMGFGLVNIPRSLWKHSNPEALLRYKYYELGKIMEERDNATKNLNGAIDKVLATKRALGRSEIESLKRIEEMLAFIREHTGEDVEASGSALGDAFDYADELPQLHAEVMKEVYRMGTIQARAVNTVKKAIWLSDVRATRAGREPRAGGLALEYQRTPRNRMAWQFWCFVWPHVLKVLSLGALALGALILWCEVTIGFGKDLSPLSRMVHRIHGEFFDQLVIMAFMVYVITCTYTALFDIGFGSLYRLTPGASSSFSLLFNGTLMARFAAPLCFNYLHVIRMTTPQNGRYTTFATKMGLDNEDNVAIPFLALGFNEWMPWLLMVVVFLVASNALGLVYRYVLCCLPQGYVANEEDADSNRYVMEGERVVERERVNVEQGRGVTATSALLNAAAYVPSAPVTLSRSVAPSSGLGGSNKPYPGSSGLLAKDSSSAQSAVVMEAGLLTKSTSPSNTRATELAQKYGRMKQRS